MTVTLEGLDLKLAYGDKIVAPNMSLAFNQPEIIGIIGPNGSGKSTLLKALSRLIRPADGKVLLSGREISQYPQRSIAQMMSILPQGAQAPGDFAVYDLVACGRNPYRGNLAGLSSEDRMVIDESIAWVGLEDYAYRRLDTLSGGERQRAWLAMALAQKAPFLMLDEPTTYLDVHHQLEMLELIRRLQQELQLTVVMVLHDLNQAIRFCERIVAVKNGLVFADGKVEEVITPANLRSLFGVDSIVTRIEHEGRNLLVCLPHNVCAGIQ